MSLLPFPLWIESTSYVFPFQMMFLFPTFCDRGLDFDVLCENAIDLKIL